MGCCDDREKLGKVRAEQKWDYINLSDFKSSSCWAPFSYFILYLSLIISVAVYAVDTFTAVNLVAFDRWAGKVKPTIPFRISRWIFAGCIVLSFILLVYRWVRAVRVMKAGGIAQSYLDPLAVRIQSVRMGKRGRGWRRFLVFTELTKSKKGADYVALFTYFSFEAWLRIVFAEGPRQVVNALTLYSVMQLNLIPQGEHAARDGHTPIIQFFVNVSELANSNVQTAVVLFGMLFTLVIWVISAINLALAIIMYLLFLWHHVPSADGSLSKYCRRKINGRAEKVIGAKVNKALQKERKMQQMEEARAAKSGQPGQVKRQPTLPIFETDVGDKLPEMPMLSRTTTTSTLPPYPSPPSSADGLNREPTLPEMSFDPTRPKGPYRSATQSTGRTNMSYGSEAPLLSSAGGMGYGPPSYRSSPVTPEGAYPPPLPMSRNMSSSTQATQHSYPPSNRAPSSQGRRTPGPNYPMGAPHRSNTEMSNTTFPSPASQYPPRGPPMRSNTDMTVMSARFTGRRPTPGPEPFPNDRSYNPGVPPPQTHGREITSTSPPDRTYTPGPPPPLDSNWPLPAQSVSRSGPTPGPAPIRSNTPASALNRNASAGQASKYVAFSPSMLVQSKGASHAQDPNLNTDANKPFRDLTRPSPTSSAPPTDYFNYQAQPRQPPNFSQPQVPIADNRRSEYDPDDIYAAYAADPSPTPSPPRQKQAPTLPKLQTSVSATVLSNSPPRLQTPKQVTPLQWPSYSPPKQPQPQLPTPRTVTPANQQAPSLQWPSYSPPKQSRAEPQPHQQRTQTPAQSVPVPQAQQAPPLSQWPSYSPPKSTASPVDKQFQQTRPMTAQEQSRHFQKEMSKALNKGREDGKEVEGAAVFDW